MSGGRSVKRWPNLPTEAPNTRCAPGAVRSASTRSRTPVHIMSIAARYRTAAPTTAGGDRDVPFRSRRISSHARPVPSGRDDALLQQGRLVVENDGGKAPGRPDPDHRRRSGYW
ncbi:hypothetical protein GCM10022205_56840 [Spinactinospora alkalitolerans]